LCFRRVQIVAQGNHLPSALQTGDPRCWSGSSAPARRYRALKNRS